MINVNIVKFLRTTFVANAFRYIFHILHFLFSSLVSFAFFVFLLFKIKMTYSDTYTTIQAGE